MTFKLTSLEPIVLHWLPSCNPIFSTGVKRGKQHIRVFLGDRVVQLFISNVSFESIKAKQIIDLNCYFILTLSIAPSPVYIVILNSTFSRDRCTRVAICRQLFRNITMFKWVFDILVSSRVVITTVEKWRTFERRLMVETCFYCLLLLSNGCFSWWSKWSEQFSGCFLIA